MVHKFFAFQNKKYDFNIITQLIATCISNTYDIKTIIEVQLSIANSENVNPNTGLPLHFL